MRLGSYLWESGYWTMLRNKKTQQEMIGFILIVVLVVIGLMVFIVISLKNQEEPNDSLQIKNLLSSILKYTTTCAIVYEPDYDNVRALIKSCYSGDRCKNLDKDACDYLNSTMNSILGDLMKTEAGFNAYKLEVFEEKEGVETDRMISVIDGKCNGTIDGAFESIKVDARKVRIGLEVCY